MSNPTLIAGLVATWFVTSLGIMLGPNATRLVFLVGGMTAVVVLVVLWAYGRAQRARTDIRTSRS